MNSWKCRDFAQSRLTTRAGDMQLVILRPLNNLMENLDLQRILNNRNRIRMSRSAITKTIKAQSWIALARSIGNPAILRTVVLTEPEPFGVDTASGC